MFLFFCPILVLIKRRYRRAFVGHCTRRCNARTDRRRWEWHKMRLFTRAVMLICQAYNSKILNVPKRVPTCKRIRLGRACSLVSVIINRSMRWIIITECKLIYFYVSRIIVHDFSSIFIIIIIIQTTAYTRWFYFSIFYRSPWDFMARGHGKTIFYCDF